jgi:hypothetical protein
MSKKNINTKVNIDLIKIKVISLKEKFCNVADPPFKMDMKRIDLLEFQRSKKIENVLLNRISSIPESMSQNYCNKLNRILQNKSKDYPLLRKQILSDSNANNRIYNELLPIPNFLKKSFREPLLESSNIVLPQVSNGRVNILKKRNDKLIEFGTNDNDEASYNNTKSLEITNTNDNCENINLVSILNEDNLDIQKQDQNICSTKEENNNTDRSNMDYLTEFDRKKIFEKINSKKRIMAKKNFPSSNILITSGYPRPSINSIIDLPKKHISSSNVNELTDKNISYNNIEKIKNIKKVLKKTQMISHMDSDKTKNILFHDFRRKFTTNSNTNCIVFRKLYRIIR